MELGLCGNGEADDGSSGMAQSGGFAVVPTLNWSGFHNFFL
jgi:hypothetical protein